MSVNATLLIILVALISWVAGDKRRHILLSLLLNLLVLFTLLIGIHWGLNSVLLTLVACLIISWLNIYYINQNASWTKPAFLSSMLILIGMTLIIFTVSSTLNLQGLPAEELMEMDMYSLQINRSFLSLSMAVLTMATIGAINDITVSIASALGELYYQQPTITKQAMIQSGKRIGFDVLNTTINTLLFATLGSQIAVFIWFLDVDYSFYQLFNTNLLVTEWVGILTSSIAITLTIPVTTWFIVREYKLNI